MYAILALFLAGLMIGRTPEFLGKKLEAREMSWPSSLYCARHLFTDLCRHCRDYKSGLEQLEQCGPSRPFEILYAFFSAAGNNGSAFAGLNANTVFYNLTLGFVMLVGRFATILPALAIAGSLASKKSIAPVQPHSPRPVLCCRHAGRVVIIVGALTFSPHWFWGLCSIISCSRGQDFLTRRE